MESYGTLNEPLVPILNEARERVIAKHFVNAKGELYEKVIAEPLRKIFQIYTGCDSYDVTVELAKRFKKSGVNASVTSNGFWSLYYHLEIEVSLPDNLKQEKRAGPSTLTSVIWSVNAISSQEINTNNIQEQVCNDESLSTNKSSSTNIGE